MWAPDWFKSQINFSLYGCCYAEVSQSKDNIKKLYFKETNKFLQTKKAVITSTKANYSLKNYKHMYN